MSYVDFHVTHPLWLLAIPLKMPSRFALPYFVSASNRVMLSYLLCEKPYLSREQQRFDLLS